MQIPIMLPGFRAIATQFDAFILDLWGVIHDGANVFPHSAETLRHLRAAGRKTILLSNAPRRSHVLVAQMEGFGIPREMYDAVMSSGEAVRAALIDRTDPFFAALGERCYHLGPERDRSVFEGVDVAIVASLADADFIVNTGPLSFDDTVEDYEDVLQAAVGRGLPMVCANPDHVVIRAGKRIVCAGAIAARYAALGGAVAQRGKPDAAIYRLCAETLGVSPWRIAVVGDALETDVAGATAAGMTSIWVTGGIHATDLDAAYGKPGDPQLIAHAANAHGLAPTAALPGFIW
ncbi:MAG: TIGR01459 family HAD-type hydrolase [Rhodospirillaceae bacterium]